MDKFSVVTAVYKNDISQNVKVALDSMLVNQSVKPSEIVLVQDGPISEDLSRILAGYEVEYKDVLRIITLEKNGGLGNALRTGVDHSRYDIVARMDSDDICLCDRFEKQLAYLSSHPECDIVGGQMSEFIGNPENIIGNRIVPLTNKEIYLYMKNRCAMNHVTVMFRKEAVLKVGNYQEWFWNEDYYLWVRMMMAHCVFANLPDIVVNVRSGVDQYARRGGKRYFESEIGIKKLMLNNGFISRSEFLLFYIERFIIQLVLPNSVRGWVFRTFARKK